MPGPSAAPAVDMRVIGIVLPTLLAVAATRNTLAAHGNCRDVGGRPAKLGQFPHQAYIIMDQSSACGGSLVTPTKVLTAAHCTVGFKTFVVVLGALCRPVAPFEKAAWSTVTPLAAPYPGFNTSGFINYDVAVLFLINKAPLSSYINLVTLPSTLELNNSYVGQNAIVSGWGRTSDGSGKSVYLRWAKVTVFPNEVCSKYFPPGSIVESTLCAGDRYSGICNGDGGGALVLKTGRRYKQIGVNSFVHGQGCQAPFPIAFTRITSALDWIIKVTYDGV